MERSLPSATTSSHPPSPTQAPQAHTVPAGLTARIPVWLLGLAGCLLAALAVTGRAWLDPAASWPGLAGDPEMSMNVVAWYVHAVLTGQNPLHETVVDVPNGFYPLWTSSSPLPALVAAPVVLLAGPVVTYNTLLTLSVTLGGFCTFMWLRRYTRPLPAFAGALMFTWSPFVMAHALGHLKVGMVFPLPLFLLGLDELLARQGMRPRRLGLLIGLVVVVAALCFEEGVAMMAIAATVVVAWAAVFRPGEVRRRAAYVIRALGVAGATVGVLAGGLVAYQYLGPGSIHGAVQLPNVYVTDLASIVVPGPNQLWTWGGVTTSQQAAWTGNLAEQAGYIGVPLIALTALALVVWWRDLRVRIAVLSTLSVLVLSLGSHLHVGGTDLRVPLPGELPAHLPLLRNLLPARLMVLVFLGLALVVAVVLDRTPMRRGRLRLAVIPVAALAAATLLPSLPVQTTSIAIPPYFTAGGAVEAMPKGTVVLTVPYPDTGDTSDPMVWQAESSFRFTMVGMAGIVRGPGGTATDGVDTEMRRTVDAIQHTGIAPTLDAARTRALRDEFDRYRVGAVLVGPSPHQDLAVRFFTSLLGAPPQEVGGVKLWRLTPDGGSATGHVALGR